MRQLIQAHFHNANSHSECDEKLPTLMLKPTFTPMLMLMLALLVFIHSAALNYLENYAMMVR
jgi:hypothetical protein